ncbi:hypothetical protein B2K11_16955, partial [Microbacterium sp. B35-30]
MLSERRWDAIVAIVATVIALGVLFLFVPPTPSRTAVSLAALVLFVAGYAVVGRAAVEPPRAAWRYPAF